MSGGRPPYPKHGGARSGAGRKPKLHEVEVIPSELTKFISPIIANQLAEIGEQNFAQLMNKAVSLALKASNAKEIEMLKFVIRVLLPLADLTPGAAGRGGDTILQALGDVNIDRRNMGPDDNDGSESAPIEGLFQKVSDELD